MGQTCMPNQPDRMPDRMPGCQGACPLPPRAKAHLGPPCPTGVPAPAAPQPLPERAWPGDSLPEQVPNKQPLLFSSGWSLFPKTQGGEGRGGPARPPPVPRFPPGWSSEPSDGSVAGCSAGNADQPFGLR